MDIHIALAGRVLISRPSATTWITYATWRGGNMAFREWVKPYLIWSQRAWLFTVMTTVTSYGVYHGWQSHGLVGALGYGLLALAISPLLASPEILLLVFSA